MTRGLSIWLDALRVFAAIVVLLSHVAYPRFTRGDYEILREWNIGSDGVILFFVLSGLVIAYAAERDKSLPVFAFNRLTRLLSVLLPALLLTFAFDQIGQRISPDAYSSFYYPIELQNLLLRGLTMSNEWGAFDRLRLGTNGPLWSLSYEAAYYVLFAIAFYLSGVRRVALMLLAAWVFGPRVLLLMPAWLGGVLVWRWVAAGGASRMSAGHGIILSIGGPLLYLVCQILNTPDALAAYTAGLLDGQNPRAVLAFSDEFIWNAMIGIFSMIHIMGMARLLIDYKGVHRRVRWWAGASFSIYVVHYPTLHLIDAVFPAETIARDMQFVFGSILVSLIFAQLFERRIASFRRGLRSGWSACQETMLRLRSKSVGSSNSL